MAEVSVGESFLFLQPLLDKISPATSTFQSKLKLDEKWQNYLKSNLLILDAIHVAAESKEYENKEVKLWLDRFKEVSYELEDLLYQVATEGLRRQLEAKKHRSIRSQARDIMPIKFKSLEKDIKHRRKSITAEINDLQKNKEKFGLEYAPRTARKPDQLSVAQEGLEDESQAWRSIKKRFQRPTSSLVTISEVIGREEDMECIIRLLYECNATENCKDVISIVGVSGVGKTTLAQLVYNNRYVDESFALKGWVHVSDEFDVFQMTKTLLEVLVMETSDIKELSSLQTNLIRGLAGKKFLLVLDDVWCEDSFFWEKICAPLLAGARGSKVIVTTQSLSVARMMGSTLPAYCLKPLSCDDSWMLFAEHAFRKTDSRRSYPVLEAIGREIVEKCDGLPSAIVTLGRMLYFKSVEDWGAVLKTNIFKLLDDRSDIFAAFLMSFYSLPLHLKRCFAFCSIFPRDHEYEEEKLIRLWMAERLVQPSKYKRIEQVGHDYFDELTSRSFFQQSSTSKSHFVMNSLLNDLAQFVSGGFFLRWVNHETTEVSHNVRHLSFAGDLDTERCKAICGAKLVRTLLSHELPPGEKLLCRLNGNVLNDLFKALQRLVVLSLSHYPINELPDSIGRLKLLQYLDVSHTEITRLPDTVSTLYNLQTLLLSYCRSLAGLPKNMGNFVNLRHLDIRETSLKEMPSDMGRLTSLQSLSDFVVGKDSGPKIKELRPLSNLRGTLHISQLQNVVSAGDASEASLKNKAFLQGLELEWSNAAVDSQNGTGVLEQLEPHRNLEKLSIISYGGTKFPNWLGDSSFKMVFLRLINCNSCSHLPPLGQLPSLKELEIIRMNGVKMIGPEFYGKKNSSSDRPFPSLEILVFREMLEWEEWISPEVEDEFVGENFPHLKRIRISGCPKLVSRLPTDLPLSTEVEISECPCLRSDDKVIEEQLLDSYGVGSENEDDESSELLTDETALKLPTAVEPLSLEDEKVQFIRNENLLDGPSTSILPEVEDLQLIDFSITSKSVPSESSKHLTGIALQSLEHKTDFPTTSHSFHAESSELLTEVTLPELPATVELLLLEGDKVQFKRNEKLLDGPSTSSPPEIEDLNLIDFSITSNSAPSESSKHLTEVTLPNLPATVEMPLQEANKVQSKRNENIPDGPSPSRLPEIEDLNLIDFSITYNSAPPESSKHLIEDSSAKHGDVSYNSSASTEISSDTDTDDDLINVWYGKESLEDISSPGQESLNVSEISQLKGLPPKLYNLKIEGCNALKSLPEDLMLNNPWLRYLCIVDCHFLKSIHESHLPIALKTLYIRNCDKLEFPFPVKTMGEHTSLEHLCIESSCESLTSFQLASFPKLRNLSIRDCKNFNSISIELEDHESLDALEIQDCYQLISFPEKGLRTPNLTSILLSNCKNLKVLPGQLHRLTSLRSLYINECPELDSIPEGGLPSSLNLLRISSCHKITPCIQWGMHKLNNFSRIEIEGGCRVLESFPEQNLLPRNLKSLQISRFLDLKSLNYKGIQHLTSLETLKINSCDKLQSFPAEGLPSSLSYLYISDCPLLKSKLQNKRGKEWYKISHIPRIQIDGKLISNYVFGDLVPTTSMASFKDGCKLLQ